MVWFRVGCCERCGGGGLGPKLQGLHGTGQHPQHCQHHPQDADDAGERGDHTIGGGGGTWPRDWYIYPGTCCSPKSARSPRRKDTERAHGAMAAHPAACSVS